jgi:dihydroxyacid dehydratase/phosphogluconate dehydratase
VTLLPEQGEDAGRIQTIGVRYVHGEISLEDAADLGCRACATPGGGCQFLGTAATAQVVGEALGMSISHSALAPSGQPIWLDMAKRSARALMDLEKRGVKMRDIVTDSAVHNAMVTHAAFGGSTNFIMHLPPSRTRLVCADRAPTTGRGSIDSFHELWMRCQTDLGTIQRSRCFSPAVFLR